MNPTGEFCANVTAVIARSLASPPATLTGGFTYLPVGSANIADTPPPGGIVFMISGTNDLQTLIGAQKFKVAAVFTLDTAQQIWKIYVVGAPTNSLTSVKATDIVILRR